MPLRGKVAAAQSFKDFLGLHDEFAAGTRGLKSRQSREEGARTGCGVNVQMMLEVTGNIIPAFW